MTELIFGDVASTIQRLAGPYMGLKAAIAFVPADAPVIFGAGDVLVTDASDWAVMAGKTNATILKEAFDRGAELYSLPGLRSKVLRIGETVVVASGDTLSASEVGHTESAWLSRDPASFGMVTSLMRQLTMQAQVIDASFIERIMNIEQGVSSNSKHCSQNSISISVRSPRAWIVGMNASLDLSQKVSERSAWSFPGGFTMPGDSPFRKQARVYDLVIQVYFRAKSKRPFRVDWPTEIVHLDERPDFTSCYIAEYEDWRDTYISWSRFQRLLKQVGACHPIHPGATFELSEVASTVVQALWLK